jgi:hypothetical protein
MKSYLTIVVAICLIMNIVRAQNAFVKAIGYDTISPFMFWDCPVVKTANAYYMDIVSDFSVYRSSIVKTDSDFNPLSAHLFAGPPNLMILNALAHSNGHLYFATNAMVPVPAINSYSGCIIETDTLYNIIAARTYWYAYPGYYPLTFYSFQESADGHLLVSGQYGFNSTLFAGKINAATGQVIWMKGYSGLLNNNIITQSPQGDIYLFTQTSLSNHPVLIKIDNDGNHIYSKVYSNTTYDLEINNIHCSNAGQLKIFGNLFDNNGLNSFVMTTVFLSHPDSMIRGIGLVDENNGQFTYSGSYQFPGTNNTAYAIWKADTTDLVTASQFFNITLGSSAAASFYYPSANGDHNFFTSSYFDMTSTQAFVAGNVCYHLPASLNNGCSSNQGTLLRSDINPAITVQNFNATSGVVPIGTDVMNTSLISFIPSVIWSKELCPVPIITNITDDEKVPAFFYCNNTLQFKKAHLNGQLRINDIAGRTIATMPVGASEQEVECPGLIDGIYFASFTDSQGMRQVVKFVR